MNEPKTGTVDPQTLLCKYSILCQSYSIGNKHECLGLRKVKEL